MRVHRTSLSRGVLAMCLFAPLLGSTAAAQDEETGNAEANGAVANSAVANGTEADRNAFDLLTERRREWLASKGLKLGISEDKQSWIGFGQVPITREPGPGWGTARMAAYGMAFSQAKAEFVEMTGVHVTAQSLSKVFSDDGAMLEFADSSAPQGMDRLAEIKAKLQTLAGPKLREALEVLGLDASDLATLGETQKRLALQSAFTQQVATQATQDLSGLKVIKSFESFKDGGSAVCVVVRWSRKDTAIAQLIETGIGKYETDYPGKPIDEWLAEKDEDLLEDWGVRVLPGPNQEPLVVCFAQSPVETLALDNEIAKMNKEDQAYRKAETFAKGELTNYVNSTTMFDQIAARSSNYEQSITTFADGFKELDLGSSTISESLTSEIKSRGQLTITGGSVERRWKAKHPDTGTIFCGVVYVWSPSKSKLAFDFKDALVRRAAYEKEKKERENTRESNDYPVDF